MKLEFDSVEEVISFATKNLGMVFPPFSTNIILSEDDAFITKTFKAYLPVFGGWDLDWVVDTIDKDGGMIPAIKAIRARYCLGLKEAKAICDSLRIYLGWFPRPGPIA